MDLVEQIGPTQQRIPTSNKTNSSARRVQKRNVHIQILGTNIINAKVCADHLI